MLWATNQIFCLVTKLSRWFTKNRHVSAGDLLGALQWMSKPSVCQMTMSFGMTLRPVCLEFENVIVYRAATPNFPLSWKMDLLPPPPPLYLLFSLTEKSKRLINDHNVLRKMNKYRVTWTELFRGCATISVTRFISGLHRLSAPIWSFVADWARRTN